MATYTSVADGLWVDDTTWSGSGTPGSGDDVIVQGHTVTVDAPAEASSVIVNGGAVSLAAQTLAVGGDVLVRSGGAISRGPNGTLTIGGNCRVRGNSALTPTIMTVGGWLRMSGSSLFGNTALTVSGTAIFLGCDVTDLDASGGTRVIGYGCKDLGGNTDVDFYLARGRRGVLMLSRRAFQTGLAA